MNLPWNTIASEHDASVNHILTHTDGGMWETRWVQRTHHYGIVYVSSHTGCALSCRFCHLTATKQTMMTPATLEDYRAQLVQTLSTYEQRVADGTIPPAQKLHVNFMARGEALDNPTVLHQSDELFAMMDEEIKRVQPSLEAHYLISTILPRTFDGSLSDILRHPNAHLYYSLYSVNDAFRKRWLPKSLPWNEALDLCQEFQHNTGKRINIHGAFIEGQNDSDDDIEKMIDAITSRDLQAKFNLVRYNPHDARHGVEPTEERLQEIFARIQQALGSEDSRIVPRVGFDVKASCGMFVERQA